MYLFIYVENHHLLPCGPTCCCSSSVTSAPTTVAYTTGTAATGTAASAAAGLVCIEARACFSSGRQSNHWEKLSSPGGRKGTQQQGEAGNRQGGRKLDASKHGPLLSLKLNTCYCLRSREAAVSKCAQQDKLVLCLCINKRAVHWQCPR